MSVRHVHPGQRVGRLYVMACLESRRSPTGRALYLVRCDCGAARTYAANTIQSRKSCGCGGTALAARLRHAAVTGSPNFNTALRQRSILTKVFP